MFGAPRVREAPQSPRIRMKGRELINLLLYDFLGLANHPAPREAAVNQRGAGAVRTIAGTQRHHEDIEREIARWIGVEATLVFQSGFTA